MKTPKGSFSVSVYTYPDREQCACQRAFEYWRDLFQALPDGIFQMQLC